MWLEAKNIHLNRLLKKLDQKRYRLFGISKNIGHKIFQLELLEGWMIHNMFNKDLLTQCIDPTPPLDIINEEEEYKAEEIRNYRK